MFVIIQTDKRNFIQQIPIGKTQSKRTKYRNYYKDECSPYETDEGLDISEIKKMIFKTLSKIVAGIDFPEDVKEPEYDDLISEFS